MSLRDDAKVAPASVLFPELHYFTNDAWPIIRGVAGARGFPVLLNNRYSKGTIFVLNIPDNIGDLYALPHGVMNAVKPYLQKNFPVRIDAPNHVALFAYDNGAFVVRSYRDEPVTVTVSLSGNGDGVEGHAKRTGDRRQAGRGRRRQVRRGQSPTIRAPSSRSRFRRIRSAYSSGSKASDAPQKRVPHLSDKSVLCRVAVGFDAVRRNKSFAYAPFGRFGLASARVLQFCFYLMGDARPQRASTATPHS